MVRSLFSLLLFVAAPLAASQTPDQIRYGSIFKVQSVEFMDNCSPDIKTMLSQFDYIGATVRLDIGKIFMVVPFATNRTGPGMPIFLEICRRRALQKGSAAATCLAQVSNTIPVMTIYLENEMYQAIVEVGLPGPLGLLTIAESVDLQPVLSCPTPVPFP
jgi:hypothetical protein